MSFEGVKRTPPPSITRPKAPVKPKAPSAKMAARAEAVDGLFQMLALGSTVIGWHADAQTYALHGPRVAPGIAKLAEDNDKLGSLLDYLTVSGPYAEAVALMLPLAMQLMVNHNMMKGGMFGTVPKDTLEAKAKVDLLKIQQMAMEEQARAEAEFAKLMEQMQNSDASA